MEQRLEDYYFRQPEPQQSLLLYWRELILGCNEQMTEKLGWGVPVFYWKKHTICYLTMDKKDKRVYVGFLQGKYMDDIHGLLQMGNRKLVATLSPPDLATFEAEAEAYSDYLQMAIELRGR